MSICKSCFPQSRRWLMVAALVMAFAAPVAAQNADSGNASRTPPQFLPYTEGQKWKEYDLRGYTSRVQDVERPEQAIVDWVLRETGTEVWFGEPLGLLSASRDTLKVYHVPAVQDKVAGVVSRFTDQPADPNVVSLRLMTLSSPNWRAKALPLMQSVPVQTPGVHAWLISKENAVALLTQLRKRTDYAEHAAPDLVIYNGQSRTLEQRTARNYIRSLRLRDNAWPGYDLEQGTIDEGYSLLISPLLSSDGKSVDAVIRCDVDQVERFVPVQIDVPLFQGQTQRTQIEVPQLVSWRLHERFRWPSDQMLLLSCGVVGVPGSERTGPLGLPIPLNLGPARADALLLIDIKGKASQALLAPEAPRAAGLDVSRGRY